MVKYKNFCLKISLCSLVLLLFIAVWSQAIAQVGTQQLDKAYQLNKQAPESAKKQMNMPIKSPKVKIPDVKKPPALNLPVKKPAQKVKELDLRKTTTVKKLNIDNGQVFLEGAKTDAKRVKVEVKGKPVKLSSQPSTLGDEVTITDSGVSARGNINLEYSEGKLIGGKSKKEIKILPSQAIKKVGGEVKEIKIKDEGTPKYLIKSGKKGKILGLIPVSVFWNYDISAESGEVLKEKKPWWNFLVKYSNTGLSQFKSGGPISKLSCPNVSLGSVDLPASPYQDGDNDCELVGKSEEIETYLQELEAIVDDCKSKISSVWSDVNDAKENLDNQIDRLVVSLRPSDAESEAEESGVTVRTSDPICSITSSSIESSDSAEILSSESAYYINWLKAIVENTAKYCEMIDDLIEPLKESCEGINDYVACKEEELTEADGDIFHAHLDSIMEGITVKYDYLDSFYTSALQTYGFDNFRQYYSEDYIDCSSNKIKRIPLILPINSK